MTKPKKPPTTGGKTKKPPHDGADSKPRKPRAKKASAAKSEIPLVDQQGHIPLHPVSGNGHAPNGLILASTVHRRELLWFLHPYIPRSVLSLVVGHRNTGKSSFVAFLLAMAKRPILLPGFEEPLEEFTIPRLEENGVDLCTLGLVRDRGWDLPDCEERLVQVGKDHRADLLIFDPISSYIRSGISENSGDQIRDALECAQRVGQRLGCAVVGVRHPGKDPNNLMVGSREWANVPRCIVELIHDYGPPSKRMLRLWKDPLGLEPPPRFFDLDGEPGSPRRFLFQDDVDPGAVDLARLVPDAEERAKVELAMEMLEGLLAAGEMESGRVFKRAEEERLSEHSVRRAAKRLGVIRRWAGQGGDLKSYWSLPTAGTDEDPAV